MTTQSKGLPSRPQPESQTEGIGAPQQPTTAGNDLKTTVRHFVDQLASDYADDIARDVKEFRRQVVKMIGARLRTRGPGRPGIPEVTDALAMREQGKSWSEVYAACIPGYNSLDPVVRQWRQWELRERVRSRRYQQRKRGRARLRQD